MQVTLTMLSQASQTRAADEDEDSIEYLNTLRVGILEAYVGIVQGLKADNKQDMYVRERSASEAAYQGRRFDDDI